MMRLPPKARCSLRALEDGATVYLGGLEDGLYAAAARRSRVQGEVPTRRCCASDARRASLRRARTIAAATAFALGNLHRRCLRARRSHLGCAPARSRAARTPQAAGALRISRRFQPTLGVCGPNVSDGEMRTRRRTEALRREVPAVERRADRPTASLDAGGNDASGKNNGSGAAAAARPAARRGL